MIRSFATLIVWIGMTASGLAQGQSLPSGDVAKSKLLFEERHFHEAKTILSRIGTGNPEYPEAQYFLGRIAVEQKAYEESIQRFESAILARPMVAEYHNWLGVMYGVLAMNANPFKQAFLAPKIKIEFEKAAALEPDNLQTQWGLITYYSQAPGFLGGSWEKAFACAKIIARLNPAQGHRAIGFIYSAQKKEEQSEKEFIEATRLEPTNPENDYALARFYDDHQKFDKAFAIYDLLLKNNPKNMVAAFHLGRMSANCGRQVEKGILCLNQYLTYTPRVNEPSHSGANLNLAMIYEKKGDKPRAKMYYEASLKLEPDMKEALDGLARLD